jgi:opacity protein-like surface antigen
MKKAAIIISALLVVFSCQQTLAVTGLGLGVRGGLIQNYDNPVTKKMFPEFSLKQMPFLGVHLKIGTLPIIDLEVSAEYSWRKKKNILYDPEGLQGFTPFKADFTIRDLSLNATVKYNFSFPAIKPYIGAGVGIHRILYEISVDTISVVFPENENKLGFHGVGGLSLKLPVFPLEFFAEGRYTFINTKQPKFDTKQTHYTTLMAGVTLNL